MSRDPGAQAGHAVPPRWGASPENRDDGTPLGSFIRLSALGKGCRGYEDMHHVTVLEFVPDRVGMVWAKFPKKILEVIYRCPFPAPDAARGGGGTPHTRTAHILAVVMAMADHGHGRSPQGALLASFVATFDVALGAANCVVGWHLLVTSWGCLPTYLCGAVHGHLVVGGVLGGDALRLPERAPEEVAQSASPRALLTVGRQRNWATQVGLAVSLGLIVSSLLLPQWDLR
jgi:hypothetical protein